jgi:putative peptidoglycan lipid II flippase
MFFFWGLGHVGLALTTALAAYVNAFLLYRGLRQQKIYNPASHWPSLWFRYIFANVVMAAVLLGFLYYWSDWQHWGAMQRIPRLMVICGFGAAAYLASLYALGVRIKDFKAEY